MNYCSRKNEIIILIVSLLCCFLAYAFESSYGIFCGDFTIRFADADDYMMLVRLRDFFLHGDFAYSLVNRVYVPFGVDLYWSRLYDFLLIIPTYIINLFVNSVQKSVEYTGFFISPIIKSILCIIVYRFFQKFMTKKDAFLGALLFSMLPDLGEVSEFGRPDHHIFIMTVEFMYLYSLVNIAKNDFVRKKDYVISGVMAVLCTWAAIETLHLILLAEAVMFFSLCNSTEKLEFLYTKAVVMAFFTGAVVFLSFPTVSVGLAYFVALTAMSSVALNKPTPLYSALFAIPASVFSFDGNVSYDKISVMHVVLYLCALLHFSASIFYLRFSTRHSKKFFVAAGLALGAAFLYRYPNFLLGVEGGAGNFLREVWFPRIQDLTSPLSFDAGGAFCFCCRSIILFVAIYGKICHLMTKKPENTDVFWKILIVINISYFIFSAMVRRMIPTLSAMGLPLIADLCLNGIATKRLSGKLNIFVTCFIVLSPSLIQKYSLLALGLLNNYTGAIQKTKRDQGALRQKDQIYKFIDDLSETPVVIMADPYSGPRLLYHTKHNVVAVPFHSQEKGVLYSLVLTVKPRATEAETREILKTTNSAYVFVDRSMCICPNSSSNLAKIMMVGNVPSWVEILESHVKNHNYIIAKVRRDEL
jgi:hypothetical protein